MSTKSTLLCTPWCHIYKDHIGSNGKETLVIDCSYGNVVTEEEHNCIEVESDSDFAVMIRAMIGAIGEDDLERIVRRINPEPK